MNSHGGSDNGSDELQATTARTSPAPSSSRVTLDDHDAYTDDFDNDLVAIPGSSLGKKRDSSEYYPPGPTKSRVESREAEFDEDTDDYDGLSTEEPLMEGLLQTSSSRRLSEEGGGGKYASDADPLPDFLTRGGGLLAGIANMSNSIVGAGIVGLPYALREAGLFSGIFLLLALGWVTDWTIRLIVLNAKMSGKKTYIDIMDTCFGQKGRAAASFFQFVFAFGGMCAFTVIVGDTIPHVLGSVLPEDPGAFLSFLISRQVVTAFFTLGVSYPLSLHRDIEKLSKASALALISMVVIIISVSVRGPGVDEELHGDPRQRLTFMRGSIFEAIGVISFAFVCHHNSLLIYGSLRTPTIDRFAQVTHISAAISVVACLIMSISGYLVFTDKTAGNILNNFAQDDVLINIARACFGANMFATLPLEAFVCREVMETYFWPGEPFNKKRHLVITTALILSALIVSLITCDLGLILELAGGFSATALAYIFPAACFLVLTPSHSSKKLVRYGAWTCCIFGVSVMVLSTVLSITKALRGRSHKVC